MSNNKNKRKKSFWEEYEEEKNKLKANRTGDIAPIKTADKDIAPVKTTKKAETEQGSGYFQKGATKDGVTAKNVGKGILGSVTDFFEDFGTRFIGMGEELVDGLTALGSQMAKSQINQATQEHIISNSILGKDTKGITERNNATIKEVKKGADDLIKKDLYDENEIAKKILSNTAGAFTTVGKTASGQVLNEEDWDIYNRTKEKARAYIDNEMESDSFLAEKSDAFAGNLGHMAATKALQAVGVPWYATTAFSSMGSETENALNNEGATHDEALSSGIVTAGGEVLSELLMGGMFGETGLDDVLIKDFSKIISSKFLSGLFKWGIKSAGEGTEEVFSAGISRLGKKLTYEKEKTWKEMFISEEAVDEYIDSFISGTLLGGISNTANAVKDTVNGIDYTSGLTNDEKAVVDKVYKDEIAKKEKGGKKLTQKEKSKIYDKVLNKLEKGDISTDTIEEVLGGETYKAYKDTLDKEASLQKQIDTLQDEYNTLNKMKLGEMTGEQTDRKAELKQELEKLKEQQKGFSVKDGLKSQLSEETFELVKGSKLAESYNEKSRRGQVFQVDLSQYDEKYHATLKKAVESGILNNTNKTHDFVDLIAKISADKNVTFDFTDNQRLKDSGFAIEGKTVNGYITENGDITVNINSAKALNRVVGHEVTHVLEGTELYDILAQSVTEYAKSKGEYDSRLETLTTLYNGVEGTNVEAELVADLVGDYVFTDADFVRKLSVENRNVFQKIYDEIKYLYKVATAGSKEARRLEKVKKTFAEVYRENNTAQKNTAENSGVRYNFGVTQSDIDNYVDAAYKKENTQDYKKYAEASPKLISDVSEGIDINGYSHALRDNDIRHIKNSHGEGTNEKYPITSEDIKKIPWIVDNYDKVFVLKRDKGKVGIIYIKVNQDGLVYYLEQVTTKYGNEPLLVNKQMIKTGIDDIPNLKGLNEAIKQKQSETEFLADLKKVHEVYAQSANQSHFNISISNSDEKVNTEKSNDNSNDLAPEKKSLSEQGSENNQYGDYNISGEDIMLEAPIRDDIAKTETVDDISPVKENTSKTENAQQESDEGMKGYNYFDSLEEESAHNHSTITVNGISITLQIPFGKSTYKVWADYNNGDEIVPWSITQDFDTFEEAKGYASMLSFEAAEYDGGLTPADKFWRKTEDVAPVKESVSETESVNNVKSDVMPKGRQFSDMDEYFKWLLDEESDSKDIAPVGAENVADSDEADRVSSLLDVDSEEAGRVSSLLNTNSEKSKGKTTENRAVETVEDRIAAKLEAAETALENNRRLREESAMEFDNEIAQLQKEYEAKKNKNTKVANNILRRIERLQQLKGNVDADYAKRISDLEVQVEKLSSPTYKVAEQRRAKQEEYFNEMEELVGDTTTWKDKKMGLSYMVNTLRRNLRDIVRDKSGKRDIKKADKIYDVLQGSYNQNEATLNREANRIKNVYAEMKINSAEDKYIQMLGELRHNPDTTLTEDEVKEYYQKHKNKIDTAKVDKAIDLARKTYDELLIRVNKVLKEQGMKQIPHRKGYFPHFTEEKQGFLGKLFNWKTKNNDIPTDIAGLTENFNPDRSWQSFNKQRTTDDTDYSFLKGMDSYVQGALDWIYHIEDIQKRRAFENYIRYVHSEQGVKDKIEAIRNNEEYDADEAQEQIDLVYKEAANPLNNFVTDFRTATNTLAGKKSSLDRGVETATNRKIYSVMTNISNRVSANMVAGSVSSALTNFIPITQSWAQVSPVSSLKAMGQTLKSIICNDGTVEKSNFLTNRLKASENLYKTTWDKIIDKAGILMEGVDSFTSQVVWRSKYIENIKNGMSESEAIKNADQFAENVIAGRSRGNLPTAFDAKNPLAKIFTTFQLEVNNQYGYMFKDAPQDLKAETKHWKANLAKGYATMFIGAYAYNALYSALAGRDAAFDPIGIVEDLLRDLGLFGDDEEEEPQEVIMNLTDNIIDELPFVGGVLGDGGRIPLSSVLPYDNGVYGAFEGAVNDIAEGNWDSVKSEIGNSFVSYLLAPAGGGQIRKTVQGLSMFNTDEEHPIAGSYTKGGDLRFPVDDTLLNRLKAGIFGQWANENAQNYIENGRKPLNEKQIQEFIDVDLPIADYWKYRDGLKGLDKLSEKGDYIGDLDLPVSKKNILINNIADRKEAIDMTDYDKYPSFEEFDYAQKNPEKYEFLKSQGVSVSEYESFDEDTKEAYSWAAEYPEKFEVSRAVASDVVEYKGYTKALSEQKADKDKDGNSVSGSRKEKVVDYINDLDIDYGAKIILYKSQYKSDNTYNNDIIDYLNGRNDISYKQMETILTELGFKVLSDGTVQW